MQRMLIALASLASGMVALYLHLWKIGKAGTLSCGGEHGCAFVQGSKYGWFLGIDVALIGTIGYTLIFLVALVGTNPHFFESRAITRTLQLLIWPAVLFTLRLKYAEFVILKSFCPWCAVSAVTITLCAILITSDARRLARFEAEGA